MAARAGGQGWRNALSLGVLMNCRGLTELVILNIGLELGLIGRDLFTMLVLMALVTTALTSPALNRLHRREVRGLVLTPGSALVPDAGAHSDRS